MKEILIIISLNLIFGLSGFTQSDNRTSAYMYYNNGQLAEAKVYIDQAILHKETIIDAKTWLYRGEIYYNIATSEIQAYKDLAPDAAEVSFKSLVRAMIMGQNLDKIESLYDTIAKEYAEGSIELNDINEELISKKLTTAELPDPDLMIRSGGEHRISNFLIWQIAYSELYVSNVLWPNFTCQNLVGAIEDYQKRERRFGLISEQIS